MKRAYTAEEKRKLTIVKYVGSFVMLIAAFYILRAVFDVSAVVAGLIAFGIAGADFMFLSLLLGRNKAPDSDRIG